MSRFLRIALGLSILVPLAGLPAHAATGAWVTGDNVRMRLVASGLDLAGKLEAAIELELADGWHTYWRNPGEAGIPPLIDLSASRNIGAPEIEFPAPHLWTDGQSTSNIYEGRVVFPLTLPVVEPAEPVSLSVKLDLGVCEKICIPVKLSDTIEVKPGVTDLKAARILTEAAAMLPKPARPGSFGVDGLTVSQTRPGLYRVEARVSVPQSDRAELFVAGPEGWFIGVPERAGGSFSFSVEPYPAGKAAGGVLEFVLVAGDEAVTQTLRLDD